MLFFYKRNKGFTLIELLVVVAIIGILASVVLASLNTARSKARDTKRKSDLKQIQIAVEYYYDKYGSYPSGVYSTTGYSLNMNVLPIVPEFLSQMSPDPINVNGSYGYYYARGYTVNGINCPVATVNDYILATRLENSSKSPVTCWNNPNINYIVGNTSEYR